MTGVIARHRDKVAEGLLRQAAVMPTRTQLQLAMRRIRHVSNLKGCHGNKLASRMQTACSLRSGQARPIRRRRPNLAQFKAQ